MDDVFPTFRRFAGFFWKSWTTSADRQALLRLIAVATEENLPLVPLIEAWASDERGTQRQRLTSLVRLLNSGTPLPDAVEAIPGILRDEDVLAIRFGAQSGALASTIREVLDESQSETARHRSRVRHALIYFANVLLVASFIVAFTHIKIAPAINKIYEDFDVQPASISRWTWTLTSAIGSCWFLIPIAAILLLWFTFSARPGRFLRRTVFARLFHFVRELRAADVLEKLSVASAAGRPIPVRSPPSPATTSIPSSETNFFLSATKWSRARKFGKAWPRPASSRHPRSACSKPPSVSATAPGAQAIGSRQGVPHDATIGPSVGAVVAGAGNRYGRLCLAARAHRISAPYEDD